MKQRLGRSPAECEWRALVAFEAAGIPAPRPVAPSGSNPHGKRGGPAPGKDAVEDTGYVEGGTLHPLVASVGAPLPQPWLTTNKFLEALDTNMQKKMGA